LPFASDSDSESDDGNGGGGGIFAGIFPAAARFSVDTVLSEGFSVDAVGGFVISGQGASSASTSLILPCVMLASAQTNATLIALTS